MCSVGRHKQGWALVLWGCIIFKARHTFYTISNKILYRQESFSFDVCYENLEHSNSLKLEYLINLFNVEFDHTHLQYLIYLFLNMSLNLRTNISECTHLCSLFTETYISCNIVKTFNFYKIHTHTHTHTLYIYIYIYIYTHTYIYMHIHTYICIHTYTQWTPAKLIPDYPRFLSTSAIFFGPEFTCI